MGLRMSLVIKQDNKEQWARWNKKLSIYIKLPSPMKFTSIHRVEINRKKSSHKMLCDLPDDVLRRILSLLPTPDAVRASMASKGLQSSFRSIPKLEFAVNCYYGGRFMDMVERILRARDDGSSITEFSLSSCLLLECSDASRVREWISDVVLRHNVQDLCLSLAPLWHPTTKLFPSCVFQSEKLRKLHLDGPGDDLPIPPRVYLPNLKDLALIGVHLVDPVSAGKLLSSPSLEKLSIKQCSFLEPITVSAPMLITVSVSSTRLYDYACPDLAIHAPNLKHIFYECGLDKRFAVSGGSPVLDEADIRPCPSEDVSNNLRSLLRDVSRVKNHLTLSTYLLQQLDGQEDHLPEFSNLTNLNLIRDSTYPYIFLDSGPLCSLLGRCPSLETLEFYMDVNQLNAVPPERHQGRFPSTLKKVTIKHFVGSDRQLLAVGFLLMRAPVLEELVIEYKSFSYSMREQQPKLLDELYFSTLRRISGRCRMRIVPAPIE